MLGMKNGTKYSKKLIAIACALAIVFAASAAIFFASPDKGKPVINMSQSICESSGGVWNECGSPCLGAPQGTVCIQSCQPQCEWRSMSATLIQANPAYSSQDNFKCIVQDNGIPFCWMAAG